MGQKTVIQALKPPVSLTMDDQLYERLYDHLFPGDGDEHGAVIMAGVSQTERGTRLLARELLLARDGIDYISSPRAHRMLTARFVAEASDRCEAESLCYLAVHNHGPGDSVSFSGTDLASHERCYPALLDITGGLPVGGLVFSTNAVAGDIWMRSGRQPLSFARIVGPRIKTLYPTPPASRRHADPRYDRHTRLFGDVGQEILRALKIGIIGLGGGGSLLNEWTVKLGVGHIVAIDFDRVDITNIPRIVGVTEWDARGILTRRPIGWLRRLGKSLAAHKVNVARRVARQANRNVRFDAVVGSVIDYEVAALLRDVDFLFLASDSIQSRLVFNALVQQYLIPGAQVGVKIGQTDGKVDPENSFAATRLVLPGIGRGCLECHELIPPGKVQEEALSLTERRRQRYVEDDEVAEPSVITLNALSAIQAANDLMMMFTGLYQSGVRLEHQMNFVCQREMVNVEFRAKPNCPDCAATSRSRRGRGDLYRLPCRV